MKQDLQSETYEQLFQRFLNCIRNVVARRNIDAAESLIADIQKEWQRRRVCGDVIRDDDRPEQGLLAALGYHVGHSDGRPAEFRRLVLKLVLEGELPMIHSADYMAEWGEPNSSKRFEKLVRVLQNLVDGSRSKPRSKLAVRQWSEDLEWIQNSYLSDGSGPENA